jgi:hypothetical protein
MRDSWFRIADDFLSHPKFVRAERVAPSRAIHLWLGLMSYAKTNNTDGLVPLDMLPLVKGPVGRWRPSALKALIDVGLVEQTETELRLHDYLEWQPGKDLRKSARPKPGSVGDFAKAPRAKRSTSDNESIDERSTGDRVSIAFRSTSDRQADLNNVVDIGASASRAAARDGDGDGDGDGSDPLHPPSADAGRAEPGSKKTSRQAKPKSASLKTRCPADFKPCPEALELSLQLGFTDRSELAARAEFVDHWLSVGELRASWDATYRNRLRYLAKRDGLKPVKRDAQYFAYQRQLALASAPVKDAVPAPADFASKLSRIGGARLDS